MPGVTPGAGTPRTACLAFRLRGFRLAPGAVHALHRTVYVRLLRPINQTTVDEGVRTAGRLALALRYGGAPSHWHITVGLRLHHPACPCSHGKRGAVCTSYSEPQPIPQEGGTP